MYDFDTVYSRVGTGAEKWDAAIKAGMQEGIVPLTIADMEFKVAPEITEGIKEAAEFGLLGYTFANDAFKETVANWMRTRHGWAADPAWISNTFGIVPAMFVAVRAFTQPGDGIIVQAPTYPPFYHAAEKNGRKVVMNRLKMQDGRFEIDFDDLARVARDAKLMLFCNPHNPGGRVWTAEEVQRVAEICEENGVLLFSDEIHCDILMKGFKHNSAGALSGKLLQNTLIGTSTAKTFNIAGLPCSSIFIPSDELRAAFEEQKKEDGYEFNTIIGLAATKAAYEKGGRWLDEMNAYVEANYDYIKEYCEKNLPKLVVCPMDATYLAWVDFRAFGMADDELTDFLRKEAQVFLNPGPMFGPGGEGYTRWNLACPRSTLEGVMQRLQAACEKRGLV